MIIFFNILITSDFPPVFLFRAGMYYAITVGMERKDLRAEKVLLIVEDNADMQLLLSSIFAEEDLCILIAGNGREALQLARNHKIDVVLLDKRLPDMDGLQIFPQLKSINPGTDIIILTAYGDQKIKQSAIQLGAYAYRTKPFVNEELIELVKNAGNKPISSFRFLPV